VLLVSGCLLTLAACGGHPTDEECIARFFAHEAQFERLRELAAAEPGAGRLTRADVSGEYLTLFDALGLRDGIVRISRAPLRIEFEPSAAKRIYYSEVEPAPLVPRLDDVGAVRTTCRCDAAFRMIDGNWYIMLSL
jgi:hypothetical protein